MQKKLFFITLLLFSMLLFATSAQTKEKGDYVYEPDELYKTCKITEYKGNETVITVPATLDGYAVTVIGEKAFMECTAQKIILPQGVLTIRNMAFNHCDSLTEVVLPEGLKTIGDAFGFCEYLVHVNIPDSVNYIHDGAFDGSYGVIITAAKGGYAESFVNRHPNLRFQAVVKEISDTSGISENSDNGKVSENISGSSFWKYTALVSASAAAVFVLCTAAVCIKYARSKKG